MRAGGGRVLVAGIGNVFFGDDGFGVEVAKRLEPALLPDNVDLREYGIRGVHLAYDLLDGAHDTLILIDAVPLNEPPGTLAVLAVDAEEAPPEADVPGVDAHTMNPGVVLQVLTTLGGHVERVFVVGCQPAAFDNGMGLSAEVGATVDDAVAMTAELATSEARRLSVMTRA
jgi:hydrogenase maturation protease